MKNLSIAAVLIVLTAGACVQRTTTNPLTPDSNGKPATTSSPNTALSGTWTSASFVVPPPSSCTNFQWHATNQTSTSIAGAFEADCAGGLTASGNAQAQLVNGTTVPIVVTGVANLPGVGACAFSLSGTGTVSDNNTTLTIPYSGTTCMGPVRGTETLHKATQAAPPPPPPPAPTPAPAPPPPPPANGDAIDLSQATILNSPTDLAAWSRTAAITTVDFSSGQMVVDFDRRDGPGRWPDVPFGDGGSLEYTLGLCENIGGRWYCSAAIQYWYGRDLGASTAIARDWYYDPIRWGPMAGYQPAWGELVGVFVVAGNARNVLDHSGTYILERASVVLMPFGGSYSPSSLLRRSR